MIQILLEAKAKKCKKFRWFFGVWEDRIICFWYLLTFRTKMCIQPSESFHFNQNLKSNIPQQTTDIFKNPAQTKSNSTSVIFSSGFLKAKLVSFQKVKEEYTSKWKNMLKLFKDGNSLKFHRKLVYVINVHIFLFYFILYIVLINSCM